MTALQDRLDEIAANTRNLVELHETSQYSNSSSWVPVRSRCTVFSVAE